MAEDILYEYRQAMRNMNLDYTGAVYNRAFIKVENLVYSMGGRNMQFYGLDMPDRLNLAQLQSMSAKHHTTSRT